MTSFAKIFVVVVVAALANHCSAADSPGFNPLEKVGDAIKLGIAELQKRFDGVKDMIEGTVGKVIKEIEERGKGVREHIENLIKEAQSAGGNVAGCLGKSNAISVIIEEAKESVKGCYETSIGATVKVFHNGRDKLLAHLGDVTTLGAELMACNHKPLCTIGVMSKGALMAAKILPEIAEIIAQSIKAMSQIGQTMVTCPAGIAQNAAKGFQDVLENVHKCIKP